MVGAGTVTLTGTWLSYSPAFGKALRIVDLVAVVVVRTARAVVDCFGRGVDVCPRAHSLLGWLLLAPTETVRWSLIFRLLSLAALWSLAIAVLCRNLAGDLGLPVRSAGPSIAIAAVMEERLKLFPLAVIAFLAPGRARRFAATDWALLGLAHSARVLHTVWSWTGHGFNRGRLLLGLFAVTAIADARAARPRGQRPPRHRPRGVDLAGVVLSEVRLDGAKLTGPDLSSASAEDVVVCTTSGG